MICKHAAVVVKLFQFYSLGYKGCFLCMVSMKVGCLKLLLPEEGWCGNGHGAVAMDCTKKK